MEGVEMRGKGLFLAVLLLLTKSAKLIKVFKVLKFLKFGKVLITFSTMVLSAFVYAFWLGPWFSVGFILMLFIHEMGHVAAMKIKGMPMSAPIFIPMLGAVVFSPPFKSREDEAFIGYAGPLVGGAAALLLFVVWALLPQAHEILLLISYTAFFLNLFNLIPISPLDGGRTTQIIGDWFKYLGLAALLLFTLFIKEPSFLLIWILILSDFKSLKPWLKFFVCAVCQVSMMVLMFAGFSSQPWWLDIFDIALASLINIFNFIFAKSIIEPSDISVDPPVAMTVRIKWFILYFALVGSLIAAMFFQTPYLPHPVQNRAAIY